MSKGNPGLLIGAISIVCVAVTAALVAVGVLPWWAAVAALFAGPLVVGAVGFLFVAAVIVAWAAEGPLR